MRSNAWIWLFSSTKRTIACSGGFRYSPTTSSSRSRSRSVVDQAFRPERQEPAAPASDGPRHHVQRLGDLVVLLALGSEQNDLRSHHQARFRSAPTRPAPKLGRLLRGQVYRPGHTQAKNLRPRKRYERTITGLYFARTTLARRPDGREGAFRYIRRRLSTSLGEADHKRTSTTGSRSSVPKMSYIGHSGS